MTGQTISHYRILEKLGEGGMGADYKAEDTRLRRTVALKFLPSRTAPDSASSARFLREAQAAGGLDHPNICHVYGMEEHDGHMFIVMAYVDGAGLAGRMKVGLPLTEALELAIQVGERLKAAHSHGIIHRDIKPANLLIDRQGVAQITDFGLARNENRSRITMPGTVLGTVASMAPEQIVAEDADARTDIWAFGVMLYGMCRPSSIPTRRFRVVHAGDSEGGSCQADFRANGCCRPISIGFSPRPSPDGEPSITNISKI